MRWSDLFLWDQRVGVHFNGRADGVYYNFHYQLLAVKLARFPLLVHVRQKSKSDGYWLLQTLYTEETTTIFPQTSIPLIARLLDPQSKQ